MDSIGNHVHLINPLWDAYGGSEQRTLSLFALLSDHLPVSLWTEATPAKQLMGRYPIRYIDSARGVHPTGGTQVFVGVYFKVGPWIRAGRPRRSVIVYNTYNLFALETLARRMAEAGWPEPELVFASDFQRSLTEGYDGVVEPSPIDLDHFRPPDDRVTEAFTVGRLSRDYPLKHHPQDPELYDRLVKAGCRIRIMGGTCLAEHISDRENVELLPQGAQDPASFLQRLDCFYYRTSEHWVETWGRVIAEAMACGLPVVVERRGGALDYVCHGENGLLFETEDQAVECILRLKDDPELRRTMGAAGRKTMESIYSAAATRKVIEFYGK